MRISYRKLNFFCYIISILLGQWLLDEAIEVKHGLNTNNCITLSRAPLPASNNLKCENLSPNILMNHPTNFSKCTLDQDQLLNQHGNQAISNYVPLLLKLKQKGTHNINYSHVSICRACHIKLLQQHTICQRISAQLQMESNSKFFILLFR